MNGFMGADTEALRAHSERVAQQAQALLSLRDTLEPLVMNEEIWRGTDAESFRESWSSGASTLFQLRSEELTGRVQDLREHAEEQDAVSSEGGEGGSDGSTGQGTAEEPFSPLGFLMDLVNKGQKTYKGIKSLADYLARIPSATDEIADLARHGLEGLWKQSYLDELFKGGKGWQAGAEKLLGKLGLPSSIGNFEPLQHLNKLDDVAPWLKTAGKGIGKALPFLDLGLGIHQTATADNWYDRTSGILSTASGALLIAAPFTGPAAPVLGAIGAGVGLVSAGMDIGKLVYENWDGITSTVGNAASAVGNFAADTVSNVGNFAADTASTVSDAVGNAASAVSEGVNNVASTVSDGLGKLGDAFGF
ncbi:hypothetical protein CFK39_03825 [Brachybacterium avium]|uniref:WXG100 family type VII secretion target n=1 Tax=Brachybacterium avium TaxID=2017485 RepID=A0A220UB18_9MICO|nr:hypothetical protein [Brachybacterium avium]ASK65101.1 hypothetical protein CFK39_03825 [Brachybacterium avium]